MVRTARGSRLRLEALEKRNLLAVDVFINGDDDLVIVGDANNNQITLTEDAAGVWTLNADGVDYSGLFANNADDLIEDVIIRSRGGLDTITITGVNLFEQGGLNDIRILSTGTANVRIADTWVGGNLVVNTKNGNDIVTLAGVTVGNDLVVNTSRGGDWITVGVSSSAAAPRQIIGGRMSNIGDDMVLKAGVGGGIDAISVLGATVGDDATLRADTNSGASIDVGLLFVNDYLRVYGDEFADSILLGGLAGVMLDGVNDAIDARISLAISALTGGALAAADVDNAIVAGADTPLVDVDGQAAAQLGLALTPELLQIANIGGVLDTGADSGITLAEALNFGVVSNYLMVRADDGNDFVAVEQSYIARKARIYLGDEHDLLNVSSIRARDLVIEGDGGWDAVTLEDVYVANDAWLDGDRGVDTLNLLATRGVGPGGVGVGGGLGVFVGDDLRIDDFEFYNPAAPAAIDALVDVVGSVRGDVDIDL